MGYFEVLILIMQKQLFSDERIVQNKRLDLINQDKTGIRIDL